MKRYINILSDYLHAGVVTIISMTDAAPNYEDVAGFNGIQLHDTFASLFFYQECLWMHKGLSEYLLLLQVNQFLVPNVTTPSTSVASKPIISLIEQSQSKAYVKASGEEYYTRVFGSYGHSKYVHHASGSHGQRHHGKNTKKHPTNTAQEETKDSPKRRYLRQEEERNRGLKEDNSAKQEGNEVKVDAYDCSIRIDSRSYYGISDSTLLTLFSWGPGDRQWLRG
jgi:hypothetical protein